MTELDQYRLTDAEAMACKFSVFLKQPVSTMAAEAIYQANPAAERWFKTGVEEARAIADAATEKALREVATWLLTMDNMSAFGDVLARRLRAMLAKEQPRG